jgi:copper resistance protein B
MIRTRRIIGGAIVQTLVLIVALLASAGGAFAEDLPEPIEDNPIIFFLLFDQLEYRVNEGADSLHWDVEGRVGGDYHRLWIKTEGDQRVSEASEGEAEVQLLYSRLISPYFDFQAGIRHDQVYGSGADRSRSFAVLGIQGLALYWFETELSLFISEDGDVSARFTGEYDLPLTQRLVLQPRVETELAVQEVEAFDVGQGFNEVELGVRLRYEIRREFAPYVGLSWARLIGETAGIARTKGEDTENLAVMLGVRMWF